MIELDLLTTHADRAYPILAGLVTPRPIAWVTTLNEDGIVHRVHVRKTFYDPKTQRIRGETFHPIGRMSVPDWYCRTEDLFELKRPK